MGIKGVLLPCWPPLLELPDGGIPWLFDPSGFGLLASLPLAAFLGYFDPIAPGFRLIHPWAAFLNCQSLRLR